MRHLLIFSAVLACAGCAATSAQPAAPADDFMSALAQHCGKAYAGRIVSNEPRSVTPDAFEGKPLVQVHTDTPDELLMMADAPPSDLLHLYVFTDADERQARMVATLDNLGKGASGAAVQNLNIMLGVEEGAGL